MSTDEPTSSDVPWFLRDGGESGKTARRVRWSETALGAPERWPTTLKTTLATLFRARQPMILWWGPELIQFYNDAYLPSFGVGKHPRAMGQRGRDCWEETWPIIGPQIEDAMQRAIGSWHEDALVPVFRNGRIEEAYWTYSYSPVFEDEGNVAGTLVICTETTQRVLAERRSRLLRSLISKTSVASDSASLQEKTMAVLEEGSPELPCAYFFKREGTGGRWRRTSGMGLPPREANALERHVLEAVRRADDTPRLISLGDGLMQSSMPDQNESVRQAYVGHIFGHDVQSQTCIVLGIGPRLAFDDSYRRFLEQIVAHIQVSHIRIEESAHRLAVEAERRDLLEQAPIPTALMVGPRHVYEIANPPYREMVGRPSLLGKAYLEAFPELEGTELPRILDRVYYEGTPFSTDEYLARIDRGKGELEDCFFKFNLQPVRDANGNVFGMMAIASDITEQVNSRRALEEAHEERAQLLRDAEQASRAKDEFLAMLGHELRNPLSPIVTALQLMKMKSQGSPTREQEVIENQVNHLVRLVDDLLDVSRIARGKVELRPELVDVHDAVTGAAETVADLLEQRRHRLSIDCPRGRFWCYADPVRLSQIIANLLSNSARYTPPEGHISVGVSETDAQLVITVEDNGVGMPADLLPRVFQLFEQGPHVSGHPEGGLGIGLALVKNLVQLHGGSVSAHSEGEGRGSELIVRLPAATPNDTIQPGRTTARRAASVSRARVLIVDDNVDAAEMLALAIEKAGHRTSVATDAPSALKIAEELYPEVAILDIGLPVMNGYELASRLRSMPHGTACRFIALTGYGQEHDRQRSREAGFASHFVKPVDLEALLRRIDELTKHS